MVLLNQEFIMELTDANKPRTNNDCRIALLTEVQRVCERYDALAVEDAKAAVRNPDDVDAMKRAQKTMAIADSLVETFQQITALINEFWPIDNK